MQARSFTFTQSICPNKRRSPCANGTSVLPFPSVHFSRHIPANPINRFHIIAMQSDPGSSGAAVAPSEPVRGSREWRPDDASHLLSVLDNRGIADGYLIVFLVAMIEMVRQGAADYRRRLEEEEEEAWDSLRAALEWGDDRPTARPPAELRDQLFKDIAAKYFPLLRKTIIEADEESDAKALEWALLILIGLVKLKPIRRRIAEDAFFIWNLAVLPKPRPERTGDCSMLVRILLWENSKPYKDLMLDYRALVVCSLYKLYEDTEDSEVEAELKELICVLSWTGTPSHERNRHAFQYFEINEAKYEGFRKKWKTEGDIPDSCDVCRKTVGPDVVLQKCAGCRVRWYCSKACQKDDWPTHKPICKEIKRKTYF